MKKLLFFLLLFNASYSLAQNGWQVVYTGDYIYSPYYYDISFPADQTGWVLCRDHVKRTTDGGYNWKRIYFTGTNNYLSNSFFLNELAAWVIVNGKLKYTSDGGETWQNKDTLTGNPKSIYFYNISTGWQCGSGGMIKKTVNGGLNWTTILTTGGNSGFISGITFSKSNPDFGIIVSDPAIENDSFWIAKTHNRGKDWVVTKAPNTAPYTTQNSVFAVDSLFYGFGLNSTPCKFYMTTNGGLSWSVKTIGLIGNSIPSIAFQNDKLNGIALSDINLPNIAKTTNGGNNWQTVNAQGLTGTGTIKWIPGTPVYFLAASNIKRSSDNGLTWHQMDAGGVTGFAHMDIYNSGSNSVCAYTIALSGKVLRYEGEPFGIDPANTSIPTEYLLFQNYPNPFNPSTDISFSLPYNSDVTVTIYDISGKEISLFLNRFFEKGNYSFTFNGSDLASGVYFYRLTASGPDGSFSDVKKNEFD